MSKDTLKERIRELEEQLEEQDLILRAISSPPLIVGTISDVFNGTAEVLIGSTRYEVGYDPRLQDEIARGRIAVLNRENYAIVGVREPRNEGLTTAVQEVLSDGRVRLNINGNQVVMNGLEGVRRGDIVVLDPSGSVIIDNLGKQNKAYALEEVPETPWSRIGGLDEVIETIQDVIETPFLHRELFGKYNKRIPKGILLSGPPGCGKTLLAKAIAYNLAKARAERTGNESNGYFINIRGPEILSKWVGVAEESIRQIFASAREKSAESGEPVVIFIDEAESIFKRRGSGISTDVYDSIVPQFLAEMDGLDSNYSVVLVLATNRPDIIDPAVLRPGRIDRKLTVPRPDIDGAREIYNIFLKGIPLGRDVEIEAERAGCSPLDYIIAAACEKLYADESVIARMDFFDGSTEPVRYRNLVSGAIIESSVNRATDYAVKREIRGEGSGVTLQDLLRAIDAEFSELGTHVMNLLTADDIRDIAGDKYNQVKNVTSIRR